MLLLWAFLLIVTGCGASAGLAGSSGTVAASTAAGDPVKVAALRAAYDLEGSERAVVFLAVTGATDTEYAEIADALFEALDVDVVPAEQADRASPDLPALTPVDPETGAVGVSLTLLEVTPVDEERFEATVRYARSGLDGGELSLTVAPGDDGAWAVTEYAHGSIG